MKGKKFSAQVIGMALAGVLVWALNKYANAGIPSEIAVAFGTLAHAAVSKLIPDDEEAFEE